jgi:hypothetical protein
MAEAQVETPPTSNKFFCHRCNVEIPRVLPVCANLLCSEHYFLRSFLYFICHSFPSTLKGFKCPECQSGFIEEMESQPQNSYSDDSSDDGDVEMVASIGEVGFLFNFQQIFDNT